MFRSRIAACHKSLGMWTRSRKRSGPLSSTRMRVHALARAEPREDTCHIDLLQLFCGVVDHRCRNTWSSLWQRIHYFAHERCKTLPAALQRSCDWYVAMSQHGNDRCINRAQTFNRFVITVVSPAFTPHTNKDQESSGDGAQGRVRRTLAFSHWLKTLARLLHIQITQVLSSHYLQPCAFGLQGHSQSLEFGLVSRDSCACS